MKSWLILFCLTAILAQNFEIRPNHVVVHSGQNLEAHVSHLPDESNFQASGGAALGSFGGFTRIIVLLVVFLGVLYHGFVPAAMFGSETIRPAPATLPVRKPVTQTEPVEALVTQPIVSLVEEVPVSAELRAEVTQKISKQAAKKLAKKAAKKLLEEQAKLLEQTKPAEQPVEPIKPIEAPMEIVPEMSGETKKKKKKQPREPAQKADVVVDKVEVEKVLVEESTPVATAIVAEVEVEKEKEEQPNQDEVVAKAPTVVEEERQEEVVKKTGWVENPLRPFEPTSVTIKRAKRLMSLHSLLSSRQTPSSDLDGLDFGSLVDPRTVNCPDFMKLPASPLLEEASPFDIAAQDTPTSIEPVRDKIISHPVVPEFVPVDGVFELAPSDKSDSPREWAFNSHKKAAWVQRPTRPWSNETGLPTELANFGLPWSPIRTPCKFAAGCKKPGCQFTHPSNMAPVWLQAI